MQIYLLYKSIYRKIKQRAAVRGIELTAALLCVQIWLIWLDFNRYYIPISCNVKEYKIIILSVIYPEQAME